MVVSKFGRVLTRGRRFIAEVDGLRFIAITAVVLFHLNGYTQAKHMAGAEIHLWEAWIPKVLSLGHYGVQLFFVLSGFLLALPFAKWRLGFGSRPSLQTYYLRRLTRLEPPYILSMLLLFLGGMVAFGAAAGISRWPNLLASLLYQHNWIYGQESAINGVAWSLEVEVQFYVLAPFLTVIFAVGNKTLRRAVLLAGIVILPSIREMVFPWLSGTFHLNLLGFLEYFLAGFLLADLYLVDWGESPARTFWWDLASMLGWPTLLLMMLHGTAAIHMAPIVLVSYVGAFRGKLSGLVLGQTWITAIGGMCYSMYLLHYPIISLVGRATTGHASGSSLTGRLLFDAATLVPAILAVTIGFFLLLERPCMDPDWANKAVIRIRFWMGRQNCED